MRITILNLAVPIYGDSKSSLHTDRDRCEMREVDNGVLIVRRGPRATDEVTTVIVPWANITHYFVDDAPAEKRGPGRPRKIEEPPAA